MVSTSLVLLQLAGNHQIEVNTKACANIPRLTVIMSVTTLVLPNTSILLTPFEIVANHRAIFWYQIACGIPVVLCRYGSFLATGRDPFTSGDFLFDVPNRLAQIHNRIALTIDTPEVSKRTTTMKTPRLGNLVALDARRMRLVM